VIPLQFSGSHDVDMAAISASDLVAWGLSNMWNQQAEGLYAVRHSRYAVSDFSSARTDSNGIRSPDEWNLLERAYPLLFPYGVGGPECTRPVKVSLEQHIRYHLHHHDKRYRCHEYYPFHVLSILQKRQMLLSARLQMNKKTFERDAQLLSRLTVDDLKAAAQDEDQKRTIRHPGVLLLKRHVHAVSSNVYGSDASRSNHRGTLWAMTIVFGPPMLWITINPDDLHHPIAQVLAGADGIDLDAFIKTMGPDKDDRARRITADPAAAALFFDFLVTAILEVLMDISITKGSKRKVVAGMGVFGVVKAYFGAVESQGRGTLHLHILVWLADTPSADELNSAFTSEAFRDRVRVFIKHCFRAHVPELSTEAEINATKPDAEVGYSLPPDPDSAGYSEQVRQEAVTIARTKQVHTCSEAACMVKRHGKLVCKRGSPWPLSEDFVVNTDGTYEVKRTFERFNAWSRVIAETCKCNNDAKLMTNTDETINLTFYITSYATKKQKAYHNASAVLAKGLERHQARSNYQASLLDNQRLMIFRATYAMQREQELAGPMVMLYLLGIGDVYCSHQVETVYWTSFIGSLFQAYPALRELPGSRKYALRPGQ
jgi:hypothetical protein